MRYLNFYKSFVILAGIVLLLDACEKTPVTAPIGDGGSAYMKILEAPEKQLFFTPFSDVKALDLFSIRRDPNSTASLNTSAKAVLTSLPGYIVQYNTDNGTSFEQLPDSLFTLKNASLVKTATGYDVNFAGGAFANEFSIAMDGSKWDLSRTYALAFGLSASDGNVLYPSLDTVIVLLSVKNKYDGKYTVTGSMTDVANSALTGAYPWLVEFHTSGPNSVEIYDVSLGDVFHSILSGTSASYYGAFGLELTFDPTTNAVVKISNVYAPAANTRNALLDNSTTYSWIESSKTLDIKYYMVQPSVITVAPHIRTIFTETFKYTGPR